MRLFITTAGEFMITKHGRYFSYKIPITSSYNYMVKPNNNTVAVGVINTVSM